MSDLVLAFTLRASERIATEGGRSLTRLEQTVPQLQKWIVQQCARLRDHRPSVVLASELAQSQVLPVLGACLDGSFHAIESVDIDAAEAPWIALRQVQGLTGTFQLQHVLMAVCDPTSFSEVEGDEVVVCLVLSQGVTEGAAAVSVTLTLDQPPASVTEAMQWICSLAGAALPALGDAFGRIADAVPPLIRPGFYAITVASADVDDATVGSMPSVDFDGWRKSPAGRAVIAVLSAYLLRCFVCAQRLERQLLAFEPSGDWDAESRQLLLARSRHLAFSRFALIKNRGVVGAPMLLFYQQAMHRLRLRPLSIDLGALLGQCSEVLQGRNAYLDSSRLRTIEVVLFVASMLSLAIGLNAIQMPPFFDPQTTNALSRLEFWLVVTGTVALFVAMWGTINGWRHTRRLIRWVNRSFLRG